MHNALPSCVASLPVQFSVVVQRDVQTLARTEKYLIGHTLQAIIINQAGQKVSGLTYAFCRATTLYLVKSKFPGYFYLVEYSEDQQMLMCSCFERGYSWCCHCQRIADLMGIVVM